MTWIYDFESERNFPVLYRKFTRIVFIVLLDSCKNRFRWCYFWRKSLLARLSAESYSLGCRPQTLAMNIAENSAVKCKVSWMAGLQGDAGFSAACDWGQSFQRRGPRTTVNKHRDPYFVTTTSPRYHGDNPNRRTVVLTTLLALRRRLLSKLTILPLETQVWSTIRRL